MMIGAISNSYNAYTPYTDSYGSASANKQPSTMAENAASAGIAGTSSDTGEEGRVIVRNPGESTEKQAGKNLLLQNAKPAKTANIRTALMRTCPLSLLLT